MTEIAVPDVRATPEQLRAWSRAAAVSRLELDAWIVQVLNEAALGRGRDAPVVEAKSCAQCEKRQRDREYRARRRAAG
jgi:hypothetical protein